MSESHVFTYQVRLTLDGTRAAILDAYADLYGQAERSLFAALRAGQPLNELKRAFLPRFGVTARQFNAIRVGLEGKIASLQELRPDLIREAETRIAKAEKGVGKLTKSLDSLRQPDQDLKAGKTVRTLTPEARAEAVAKTRAKLHQKKRRLGILRRRRDGMKADQAAGTVRLCFGSRKLFHAQFDLDANGYDSHADWQEDWRQARSNQFFVLGSQDETAGNQTCQAVATEDGSLTLRLRLPNALSGHGKTREIHGVRFAYGQDAVTAALGSSRRVSAATQAGKAIMKRVGSALSYRFLRDDKGWRVFVSVEVRPVAEQSRPDLGAIGVDVNADHLAVAETDRFGNLIQARRIELPVYGKTTDQAKAVIGDAVAAVVSQARSAAKPLVIEALNFQKKKAELETADPRQARMLSSFACNKVASGIKSASFRAGIEVVEVNPAYTSVIGAVNHAQSKGISVHLGAAYAIARRGLDLSERPTLREAVVPTRNGGHVTFDLPAKDRSKHVWSHWSKVRTRLKAAHVAHFRSGEAKANPAPLRPSNPAASAYWTSTAEFRGANRQENCSPGVLEDVPW